MFRRLAGVAVCLGFACGTALADSSAMNGDWRNVNPKAQGLARVEIAGRAVHPYGACKPAACDWGVLSGVGALSGADLGVVSGMRLKVDRWTDSSHVVLTLSPEPEGRLRVQTLTHFTDKSGRADLSTTEIFERVQTGDALRF